jgi:hypothetical protein
MSSANAGLGAPGGLFGGARRGSFGFLSICSFAHIVGNRPPIARTANNPTPVSRFRLDLSKSVSRQFSEADSPLSYNPRFVAFAD